MTMADSMEKVAESEHCPYTNVKLGPTDIYTGGSHYSASSARSLHQMPIIKPDLDGHTIVFFGPFNPQVFQPDWFASQNLIKKDEAERAKIKFISHELELIGKV